MFANTSVCVPILRRSSSGLALVVPSRKRARDDGIALALRSMPPSQPMRIAKAPARGRRMLGWYFAWEHDLRS